MESLLFFIYACLVNQGLGVLFFLLTEEFEARQGVRGLSSLLGIESYVDSFGEVTWQVTYIMISFPTAETNVSSIDLCHKV